MMRRLGALLRLCGDEECFKETIGTELDIDNEACGIGTSLGGPRRGVANLHFGWNFFAFGGRSTPWGLNLKRFLSKSTTLQIKIPYFLVGFL